ncbi:MAG: transglycosylase SLT domain-containing protein [candidate division KSB1 bacterium]|nr:transglycosylase SLT domain-containing protein [candidate division KSB1 bacterium]MDQ7065730.1 transglycosylase SLT domain-containing protein [candidate division KSB1 bacterium]
MEKQQADNSVVARFEYVLCNHEHLPSELDKSEIRIGSSKKCDICITGEGIRAHHCTLRREKGQWILDIKEGCQVWINDRRVRGSVPLPSQAIVFLGKLMGPGFRLIENGKSDTEPVLRMALRDMRAAHSSMMAAAAKAAAEKPYQRKVVSRWFHRLDQKYQRRLRNIIISMTVMGIAAGAFFYHQQVRINRMHKLAEDIFYQMKEIELQISRAEKIIEATGDSSLIEQNNRLWTQFERMSKQYDAYLRELGFGDESMPEDERIILRMARVFGECELNAPKDFVQQVRAYINKWRTTPRYRKAITRALESGYVSFIARTMLKHHLPPHFMYLAMQESDFDPFRCGPRTRYGIAKGMWQFIPTTAVYFGLKLGPLVEVRRPDPKDERHDVRKSTRAAAKYIKFLYTTEAQASGLLVMASYNWGETKVRRLISKLPENPRERNFWNLMKKYKLPRETRDYVFYIFSAAVIGENPKLFGFDLENPLQSVLQKEEVGP